MEPAANVTIEVPRTEKSTVGKTATDPVCGITVDPATAAGSTTYDGITYWLCSPGWRDAFIADPDRLLGQTATT